MLKNLLSFVDRWVPERYWQDDELLRKSRMLVETCMLVMVFTISYIVFYVVVGYWMGVAICGYGFSVGLYVMADFKRRGSFSYAANFFCGNAILFFGLLTLTTFGLRTLVASWILMIPLSAFMIGGVRTGVFYTVTTLLLILVLFIFEWRGIGLESYFQQENFIFLNPVSLGGLLLYLSLISLNNEVGKERVRQNLVLAKGEIEQKNTEITRINRNLEAMVMQRTEKLRAANEELDTFLYESSHALRQPLMRIVGLMSLIKEEQGTMGPDSLLALVDHTVENMDTMLHSLILVSEIHNHNPEFEPVDMQKIIDRIMGRYALDEFQFGFEAEPLPEWRCDAFLLQVLLERLVDNAATYREEDGRRHQVQVEVKGEGAMVAIRVRDNGMGIDPMAMPGIFKMFVRGTEKSRGSGLGLFIARKITDRLGGEVWVESEPGRCTLAEVLLPVVPAQPDS